VAPLLARADDDGVPVRGELSLFASALADLKKDMGYAPKVVAITGTNGKTTTTSLTAKLIERAGLRVGLAGNIGPTLLDTLRLALEQEPRPLLEDEAAAAEGVPAETAPDAIEHAADEATGDTSATAEDAGIAAQDAQDAELDAAEAAEA